MKKIFWLFLLTVFIFGTSCRNDDDGDNDALSGYKRIVNKNFKHTSAEVRANGIILANRSLVFDYERDNVTRYESSGIATTRYGVLKCDPTEPNEEFYFGR